MTPTPSPESAPRVAAEAPVAAFDPRLSQLIWLDGRPPEYPHASSAETPDALTARGCMLFYAEPVALDDIEQYRQQMAGISTAAIGYWKEGDTIHPDYDTIALRDVAKLYAKYDALYRAAAASPPPQAEPARLPPEAAAPPLADGWQLVPVEPTEAMVNAARDCQDADPADGYGSELFYAYKAMLAASPPPPAAAGEVQRWISVDERLPELNTEVLVAFDTKPLPATAQLTMQGGIRQWSWPSENDPREGEEPIAVTHWMSLPPTPYELLAATPRPLVPLTDERVIEIWGDGSDGPSTRAILAFVRAIEAAHGITQGSKT